MLTSDDEHAVSVLTAGPFSPNRYEMRPDATLSAPPVAANTDGPGANLVITCGCSMELMPTKTPTSGRGQNWSTSKAPVRSSFCCVSMCIASASDMEKQVESNASG